MLGVWLRAFFGAEHAAPHQACVLQAPKQDPTSELRQFLRLP